MATTTEEFKTTIQEFADRARSVLDAAEETAKQAAEGITLTRQSAVKSEEVRSYAEAAGRSVLSLAEQMQRIGEITATVNEIAEQTKLLALNASIEAARAGEGGRGFAVVATQVRELAKQSKQAALRIDSLIGETQNSTRNVVGRIKEGSRLSDETAELTSTMAERFARIANSINQTTEAVKQIATGAQQQEESVVDLAQGMAQVNTGAKESLAAAEQARMAIAAIDRRIASLSESMAKFKT
jgi:methyl-accepting chemotaxis protein